MRGWRLFLTLAVLLATGVGASGYALLGVKWNFSPVTMHLELGSTGALMDGSTSFDAAASGALATWNHYLLQLQFKPVIDSGMAQDGDGINQVTFSTTIFGEDFGDAVAVTTEWDVPGNSSVRREADVLFNANLSWNSYRGPLKDATTGDTLYDLRRVALHEFGHVVGLDHPDEAGQSVDAIMNSRVSNTDDLQADDIRGGQFLYGAQPGTYIGKIATIDRPKKNTVTTSGIYLMQGSADPARVRKVYLVNSSFGAKRFFKVKRVQQWKYEMPLKIGTNSVTLYIQGFDGSKKKKVTKRLLTRTISD